LASGGGLYTSSTNAVILNSTFDNNVTHGGDSSEGGTTISGFGQAGPRGGDALGAGVANAGLLFVTNSTFFQNHATGGAGGDGGPGGVKGGAGGAGGNATGGGLYNAGTVTVVNCTFSKGDAAGGDSGSAGSGATAGKNGKVGGKFGGNIANVTKKNKTAFTLANSILGPATSGNAAYGTINDGGYNISADKSIKFKKGASSLMNTNALEGGGALADNGGPTRTIALATNSPAIDMIPSNSPPTDQRGFVTRPQQVFTNDYSDVGAFELDTHLATIITGPQSTNVFLGSNVTFSVVAGGDEPISYQWFFNGSAISDATSNLLFLANVQLTNGGSYSVSVSNALSRATSSAATLTVTVPTNSRPIITNEPALQLYVPVGGTASFTVSAIGSAPLSYQWFFLASTTNAISGATNPTITISNAQFTNQGSYVVLITNQFGFTNSRSSSLFVTNASSSGITPP
jgi:hypothetical protein